MSVVRKINHIFVIQSLLAGDLLTGKELYEDVIKRRIDLLQLDSIKMTHQYFEAQDKNCFVEILKYIEANANYLSGGILIHIESHGSENNDGLILSDNSIITWTELVELFRPINIATCNKLYVTMATCYGRSLYLGVDPLKKSPYQAYISASKAVTTMEVLEKFKILFEILIEHGDLVFAYTEHEKNNSPFFYKDSLTTFEDSIIRVRDGLDTDDAYRQRILDHPILKELISSGTLGEQSIDYMIKMAFNEMVKRHSDAFDFPDCK